jgi:hypothetical protein
MCCRCARRAVSLSQLFPFSGGVIANAYEEATAATKDPQGRFYSENAEKLCLQTPQRSLTNEAPEKSMSAGVRNQYVVARIEHNEAYERFSAAC